jgi:hypothetical protein
MKKTLGQELYCRFEGNADDASGNSRNGSVSGAVLTPTYPRINADIKGALFSNGADDYVTVPNTATVASATKVTMFAWVRLYAYNTATAFSPLYQEQTASNTFARCAMRIGGTTSEGLLNVGWRESANEPTNTQYNVTGTTKLALNTPYFVMATIDTTTNEQKLYINDSLEATGSQSTGAFGSSTTNGIEIARNGGAQVLDGVVGKVGLCIGEILDLDDAEELYNGGVGLSQQAINTYLGSKLTSLWDLQSDYEDKKGTNHGTPRGNTYLTPPFGRAYLYDGVDDVITYGTGGPYNLTSGGLYTWNLYAKFTDSTATKALFAKSDGITGASMNPGYWCVYNTVTNAINFRVNIAGGNNFITWSFIAGSATSLLFDGRWHAISLSIVSRPATPTDNDVLLMVDGLQYNTETLSTTGTVNFNTAITNSEAFRVGNRGTSGTAIPFKGAIDEFIMYTRSVNLRDRRRYLNLLSPLEA